MFNLSCCCLLSFHIIDLMESISMLYNVKTLFMFSKYAIETFLLFHILLDISIFHILQ